MKRSFELLLSFSSFSIHNSSFSFTYPLAAGGSRAASKSNFIDPGDHWRPSGRYTPAAVDFGMRLLYLQFYHVKIYL